MRKVFAPLEFQSLCEELRASGKRIGLVPTMGALHRGHAALIEEAARRADVVVVTVFVNPTQFGPAEDFAKYPRTLDADVELAQAAGASVVFAPSAEAMYPQGDETRVKLSLLPRYLCGEVRPTHFEGVSTVVAKLFALAGRSVACFGRKDYQQLKLIERMTTDLFFPVTVIGVPTVREEDGLAMSSRNRYLSPEHRARARAVPLALDRAVTAYARGERNVVRLEAVAREVVASEVDSVDYVTVADSQSIDPLQGEVGERALLALAVRLGGARLIDNVVLGEEGSPLRGVS